MRSVVLAVTALLVAGCVADGPRLDVAGSPRLERTPRAAVTLERVSTAVPWPRGLRFHDGRLIVVARGVHRSAGGPDPAIEDRAGTLFVVDPDVGEPVVPGEPAGRAVRENGRVLAEPTEPPFRLWNRTEPSTADTHTDRPYCMLVFDEASRNFFLCGYSGIDLPGDAKFRKNATDSVLRYDLRDGRWHVVESHDPDVVPASDLGLAVPNRYYPHHDPSANPPPHGLLNGPCGAIVVGRYLYVGAKDNTALAQYVLDAIRDDPGAGPPPGRLLFHRASPEEDVYVPVEGHGETYVEGTCALAVRDGYLYVAFRTTSQILRFPLTGDGDLVRPLEGQLVAQFAPYDPERGGGSANIYDLTFDAQGRLYVSPAYMGAVYRFVPDPGRVFDPRDEGVEPYVDLRALTGNPRARTGNIALDDEGNLYIASGNKDVLEGDVRGAIYRVPAS